MGHYDNCRDDHFPDAGKMVDPLNTKTLTAADLVEIIAHKEQIGIWANEIATAISLGDMLKEDWSFDDIVDLEREIVAQLRDVLSSAFSHPAYDIATLITTQQQEIERLTKEHAASQAVIEVQRQKLDTNAGWEAASAAESRVLSLEEEVKAAALHVEQLSGLLKIIREHWVDYDHIFSISVHEADTWLSGRQALSEGE